MNFDKFIKFEYLIYSLIFDIIGVLLIIINEMVFGIIFLFFGILCLIVYQQYLLIDKLEELKNERSFKIKRNK